jgi:hypothetical protein
MKMKKLNSTNNSKKNNLISLPLKEDANNKPKASLFKLVKPITEKKENNNKSILHSSSKKYWSIEQDYAIFYVYLYHNSKYRLLKYFIKDKSVSQMRSRFYNQLRSVKLDSNRYQQEDINMKKILITFDRLTKELMVSRNYTTKEEIINFISKEVGIVNCSNEIFSKIDGINILAEVKNFINQSKK